MEQARPNERILKTVEIPDYDNDPTKGGTTIVRVIQYKDFCPKVVIRRKTTDRTTGDDKEIPFAEVPGFSAEKVGSVISKFGASISEQWKKKKEAEKKSNIDEEDIPL